MVQQNILIGAGVTLAAVALQKRQHAQVTGRTRGSTSPVVHIETWSSLLPNGRLNTQ